MKVGKIALAAIIGAVAAKFAEKPIEHMLQHLKRQLRPKPYNPPPVDEKSGTQPKSED